MTRDTIFALSSGRGPAAIAVVRMSGPQARFGLETLISRLPEPRAAGLRKLRNPKTKEVLDEALVLWFPGPGTETGEDMVELHLHGGRAVVAAVLDALGGLEGLRPAEAGEFTRRAFENGKIDLTAVEGLADLVSAETEAQRAQALRQYQGLLAARAETWRARLIEAMALVEAGIDFSDEADVPADLVAPALAIARALVDEIAAALADGRRGERLREGLVVAIAGPPNAGKSSLLNRLARREAAIVSPYAGTTRDVIEVHLDLEGYPVTLLDTAGIRDSEDPVEQEGVRRAQARAASADLVLWVVDVTQQDGAGARKNESVPVWWVWNKMDTLVGEPPDRFESGFGTRPEQVFRISAVGGAGIGALVSDLARHAASIFVRGDPPLITRERHRRALEQARAALERGIVGGPDGADDILAEELRLAARALGRLTGRVDVEDVLDMIFRDFCIGK
jgi:tRNA modification GTPase